MVNHDTIQESSEQLMANKDLILLQDLKKKDKVNRFKGREESNFFMKWSFGYLDRMFKWGSKGELLPGNYPAIEEDEECDKLSSKFLEEWNREAERNGRNASLYKVLFKLFGFKYIVNGIFYLVEIGFLTVQGYLISLILAWFQRENADPTDVYIYAVLMGSGMILNAFNHHIGFFQTARTGMQMRVTLIAVIYRKCMNLSISNTSSTGLIVNLVSNDVQRFEDLGPFLHYIWVAPVQLLATMYLIYTQIGWSSVACGLSILLLLPIQSGFAKLFKSLRRITVKFRDERIKTISNMLAGIMVVKLYAWEIPFIKKINEYRDSEMANIWRAAILKGINQALSFASPGLINMITFTTFYLAGGDLTPAAIFSVIAYIQGLRICVTTYFPMTLQFSAEAMISVQRVRDFLLLPEVANVKASLHNDELESQVDTNKVFLALRDASFTWGYSDDDQPVLEQLNLTLEKKQLIAVCGQVGAGKSSFLNSILGDLKLTSGKAFLNFDKVAYVSQSAWILSGTIKENILFGQPYDETRFEQVIKVCCLDYDFSLFEKGADTVLGEKGVTLSGGQRARVSLARAIYYDADLYLLDDPLSAVDTKVGRHLFEKCIKGALAHKTVLLITHQLQFAKKCSRIIVLDKGRISQEGTFDEIIKSDSVFSKTLQKYTSGSEDFGGKELEELELADITSDIVLEKTADLVKEDSAIGHVKAKTYYRYLKNGTSFWVLFGFIILLLGAQLFSVFADFWLANWSTKPYSDQRAPIYVSVFCTLAVLTAIAGICRTILFYLICNRSSVASFKSMLNAVFRSPITFFQTIPHGRIMNRMAKDMNNVDEMLPQTLFDCFQTMALCISVFVVAAIIVPFVLILVPILIFLFLVLRTIYVKTSRQVKRLESVTRSPVYSTFPSTLDGLSIIRAFSAEERFKKDFFRIQNENSRINFIFISCGRWLGMRLDIAAALLVCVIILVCIWLRTFINVTPAKLGLVITYMIQLTGLFQWATRQSTEVENLMVSTERVFEYTELPSEAADQLPFKAPENWPLKGDIQIDNMSLAYPNLENPGKPSPPVLKNLKIHFAPGTKVGIVGRTGAGKSSFIQALFRLIEPTPTKSIIIDDIHTSDLGLTDLRSKLSIIPQEPVCFKGTIRFNLDPFNFYSDEQLWKVLEAVELKNTLSSMPEKLDSPVTENGANWSVGERQLICFARAILKNSRLIVMDEATSSVDVHTDQLIQKAIRAEGGLFVNSTVLTIAHRLNTVIDYDKIMVLEAGQIVEYGSPSELLAKSANQEDAWFARMVREMGKDSEEALKKIANEKK
ncbi:Multidrug resistance-associated protein 4 [Boothiomyces sp. JEL0866]|nr:Multidrug resistance-associated protein 4 [Boothiomyces sp. JEL0866]